MRASIAVVLLATINISLSRLSQPKNQSSNDEARDSPTSKKDLYPWSEQQTYICPMQPGPRRTALFGRQHSNRVSTDSMTRDLLLILRDHHGVRQAAHDQHVRSARGELLHERRDRIAHRRVLHDRSSSSRQRHLSRYVRARPFTA